MKRAAGVLLVVLAIAAIGGCTGPDGNVFIEFGWTYAPDWFNTTDDNLPITIYRDTYYQTVAGSHYFEYYHSISGYTRWIWYTLTANDGALYVFKGQDALFELYLYAYDDPELTQWQSAVGVAEEQPDSVAVSANPMHSEERRVQTWERTETNGGWTLSIKGGVIEP
jgi:hypothetical protein